MILRALILSYVFTPLVAIMPAWAESPYAHSEPSANDTEASTLQLRLIQSEEAVVVNTASAKGFTVEVTNGQGTPVAGAAVAFRLPDTEPTGTFTDGSHSVVVYTDALGRASAAGIQWGTITGVAEMRVTAAKGILHAGLLVSTNLAASSNKPSEAAPALATLSLPGNKELQAPGAATAPTGPQSVAVPVSKTETAKLNKLARGSVQTGASTEEPTVTIANAPGSTTGASGNSNKKKWLIIAALGVGAGVGAAMALGHGGGSATPAAGVTIGSPTISIGH